MFSNAEKIEAVLEWSNTAAPSSFDPSFVESLQERVMGGRQLSAAQAQALDNIIEKFDIDVSAYL